MNSRTHGPTPLLEPACGPEPHSLASVHVVLMQHVFNTLTNDRPLLCWLGGVFDHEPDHTRAQAPYIWMVGPNVFASAEAPHQQTHRVKVLGIAPSHDNAMALSSQVLMAWNNVEPPPLPGLRVRESYGVSMNPHPRRGRRACIGWDFVFIVEPAGVEGVS